MLKPQRIKRSLGVLMALWVVLMAPLAVALWPTQSHAQQDGDTIFAIASSNTLMNENMLIRFNSTSPETIDQSVAITGLPSSETLAGLDFRPATGQLYAISNQSRLYTINTETGAATQVGTNQFMPALSGGPIGFDFNPVVDRIRLVNDARQNLRINPITGAVAMTDANLAYAPDDSGAMSGQQPRMAAVAYTNNAPGATSTTLYVIDFVRRVLALQGSPSGSPVSPNSGQITTVGPLNIGPTDGFVGFDIAPSGTAYATVSNRPDNLVTVNTIFGTLDLATGAFTTQATIGGPASLLVIRGIAVQLPVPTATPTPTLAPGGPTTTPVPTVMPTSMPTATTPPAATTPADLIFAITNANRLIEFSSAAPGTIIARQTVTGLQDGERILGIDFRPRNQRLYAVGSTSRIYTIDPRTGAATLVGTQPLTTTLEGTAFGFDFNPVPDRIRIIGNSGQNLRVNPDTTGAVVDGRENYAAGDSGAGSEPQIVGAAYTNNVSGTTTTQLYVIDAARDVLALQNPPNNGTLNTVGALNVDADALTGFDIAQNNTAYAVIALTLYTVNLSTGQATSIGMIGGGEQIQGIAATLGALQPPVQTLYALSGANQLVQFNSNDPGTLIAQRAITDLGTGETLQALDFRPVNNQLYAVSDANRLYTVDPQTGKAAAIGTAPFTTTNQGTAFGFDFNPTVDRIRLVSDTGSDLRLNPTTGGLVAVDGRETYGANDPGSGTAPQAIGAGYTNNFAGSTATTLYVIDAARDVLTIQNPPNNGTLGTVGGLGVDTGVLTGFDITFGSTAFATFTPPDAVATDLYSIDLSTGRATRIGTIGGGATVRGLAAPVTLRVFLPIIGR